MRRLACIAASLIVGAAGMTAARAGAHAGAVIEASRGFTAPATAATAHVERRLTPAGASTQLDAFTPVAGSPSSLVYFRDRSFGEFGRSADMFVRRADGSTRLIGQHPYDGWRYSIFGNLLIAGKLIPEDYDGNEAPPDIRRVYVWHLDSGHRSTIKLPAGAWYLGAGPESVVYSDGPKLLLQTIGGATTSLGTPFGTGGKVFVEFGATGPDGIVVGTDTGQVAYVRFAGHRAVTTLDSNSPGGDLYIDCLRATSTFAACVTVDSRDDVSAVRALLIPLDGSPLTAAADVCPHATAALGDVAVAGSSLLFTCKPNADSTYTLYRQAAGSAVAMPSAPPVEPQIVSADGGGVVDNAAGTALLYADPGSSITPLIKAHHTPTSVDSVALTPGLIEYSDNELVPSAPQAAESVFTRRIETTGSKLTISPPTRISRASGPVEGRVVGISKSLKVYATDTGVENNSESADLHIISSTRTATIHHVSGLQPVVVSGHYVTFFRNRPLPQAVKVIYNARSGATTTVRDAVGANRVLALWHDRVAYITEPGAVEVKNLTTGKITQLAPPLPHDRGGVQFRISIYGNWVGWHANPKGDQLSKPINMIRNAATMAPAIAVPHTIYSLTSNGVLLDDPPRPRLGDGGGSPWINVKTTFWLRAYSSHRTVQLLPAQTYQYAPQVAAGVMAWAGPDGVLRARPLPR